MKFNNIFKFILENHAIPVPNSYVSTKKFNREVKKTNKQSNSAMVKFLKEVDGGKVPKLEPKTRKFTTQSDGGIADLREQGVPPGKSCQVFGIQVRHSKPSAHFICTVYEGKCILMRAFDDYNEYNMGIDNLPGSR